MYISDTLSRAYLKETGLKTDSEINYAVHAIIKTIPMSDDRKKQFKLETSNDPQLNMVMRFINEGWPRKKEKIPESINIYVKLKDKIFCDDNLLFMDNKIIVPFKLRKEMLKLIHEGHLGIEKTKARARSIFYWPGQASDIESYIKSCQICEKYARKNARESLLTLSFAKKRLGKNWNRYLHLC